MLERVLIDLTAKREVLRVDSLGPFAAELFLKSPASKIEPLLIDIRAKVVCVRNPNEHGRCICHVPKALFALAQCFFGPFAFCYVEARADVTEEVSARREAGDARIVNPAILTVKTSKPVLHRKRFSLVEGCRVGLEASLPIIDV